MTQRKISVAIVGSGPSGFFAAEALLDAGREVEIDIIERLPSPFGLIRFGVAPDHQVTKRVTETYDAIAESPQVRFFGNVTVGTEVQIEDLRNFYDAVILATGAPEDAPLSVPGSDLQGVYGCAQFVGWYNGHPDHAGLAPSFDTDAVAVLGMGNVALDVIRVLTKSPVELETTDICEYALSALRTSAIRDVYVLGRRGPLETRFSNVELREIGTLEGVSRVVDARQLENAHETAGAASRLQQRNFQVFQNFASEPQRPGKRVHFIFNVVPDSILGGSGVDGIRLRRAGESTTHLDLACGMIIGAIGFRGRPIPGVPFDPVRKIVPNENGKVADSVYAVGWIKRGPSGVIGTNKPDGALAAQSIIQEFPHGGSKEGRAKLIRLLVEKKIRWIDYEGWKRIDRTEREIARPGSPRQKLHRIADMMTHAEAS